MSTPRFHAKSTALEVIQNLNVKLDGKVVLITGATSGIGIETARAFATARAHVIITGRDLTKGAEVIEDLRKTTGNDQVELMELDLSSFQAVRNFVEKFRARHLPINILICNAGIMACPYTKTVDGFESQFGVNHLAHFLLATSLIPELKAGAPSRLVVVSSLANKRAGINWDDINWEKDYNKWMAYSQSKTANILFARQFDKLYAADGIHAFSLHPGVIVTNLGRHVPEEERKALGWTNPSQALLERLKNVEQGASTTVYAAIAPELENHGGEYLENCAVSEGVNADMNSFWGMGAESINMESAERLWVLSEQLVTKTQEASS